MKIYHYTSIETLALILKNKTIRFNRLDHVDDVDEAAYGSGVQKTLLGQYSFVSCWTKEESENIALWNMYTNYKGVRIGLDEDMFITYAINNKYKSFISSMIKFEDDYFISAINNEAKLYDIQYVQSPETYIKDLIHQEGDMVNINTNNIGIYKRKEWDCQKESRFRLTYFPVNPKYAEIIKRKNLDNFNLFTEAFSASFQSLKENYPLSFTFRDIPLKPEILDNIEVMLGPCTSEGEKAIVEALLKGFKNYKIKDSLFKGKIRRNK